MKPFEISVFVGSSTEGLAIASAIGKMLNDRRVDEAVVRAKVWNERSVFGLGKSALEALQQAIDRFAFAIMVFTPDDIAQVRRNERGGEERHFTTGRQD